MSNNTDIEELEQKLLNDKPFQHILKFAPESQRELMTYELAKYFDEFIRQKVIEARIDELEAVSVSTIRQSAKSGRIGEWVTIDERIANLQAQLNHNKKGDSDERN